MKSGQLSPKPRATRQRIRARPAAELRHVRSSAPGREWWRRGESTCPFLGEPRKLEVGTFEVDYSGGRKGCGEGPATAKSARLRAESARGEGWRELPQETASAVAELRPTTYAGGMAKLNESMMQALNLLAQHGSALMANRPPVGERYLGPAQVVPPATARGLERRGFAQVRFLGGRPDRDRGLNRNYVYITEAGRAAARELLSPLDPGDAMRGFWTLVQQMGGSAAEWSSTAQGITVAVNGLGMTPPATLHSVQVALDAASKGAPTGLPWSVTDVGQDRYRFAKP